MKRGVLVALGLGLLVLFALQCRFGGQDAALIGVWKSLDGSDRRIVFRPNGDGMEGADLQDSELLTASSFEWSTTNGTLTVGKYDEDGPPASSSADYMIRKGMLSLVGELPDDWSSAYRFERSLESLPR